ncbi:hypothetical protein B0H65DRAFT_457096 [Neurospora tetraspora]|uniref:Secreted protein n=1 Tax=Neurospora tetraspora TaxID=94610 RepID=A0AAE0JL24_9PEZI|nr:hypothetical protein B0H65DRAFT_457096 [Neurospora tetraspora]
MGERTGSRVFQWVWSYVMILPQSVVYEFCCCCSFPLTSSSRAGRDIVFVVSFSWRFCIVFEIKRERVSLRITHETKVRMLF